MSENQTPSGGERSPDHPASRSAFPPGSAAALAFAEMKARHTALAAMRPAVEAACRESDEQMLRLASGGISTATAEVFRGFVDARARLIATEVVGEILSGIVQGFNPPQAGGESAEGGEPGKQSE